MRDFKDFTIRDIHEGLVQKQFSALEITQRFLEAIEQKDKQLNAFLAVTAESALQHAQFIDKKIAEQAPLSPLASVPCSLKDAILMQGVRCTAGSRILENYVAPYDATVTRKLKEAGAVMVGKTNMDEFGMGASTENSAFAPTRNPHDLGRVAGGSSGGSAASVAAGECVISLGEDTGGSIRLPASFCGVAGLKPTYGAVSRYGIIALASSLDQVGPFAKTVEDCEIVFEAIRGKDPLDSTSVDMPAEMQDVRYPSTPFDKTQGKSPRASKIQDFRIGVPREYFGEGLDSRVGDIIRGAIEKFEHAGAHIEEISLPHTPYALAVYYIINTSEASANLARYDGVRYGVSRTGSNLMETYLRSRGQGLGTEAKRRIMLGTYALSAGYYDAYYLKAQKIRTLLKQDFDKAFEKVDVIAGPVTPFLPFKIGERIENPLAMYLVDVYTVPVNLVGLPALSLPCGSVGNLPVGLQLIARPFGEPTLFRLGKLFETIR